MCENFGRTPSSSARRTTDIKYFSDNRLMSFLKPANVELTRTVNARDLEQALRRAQQQRPFVRPATGGLIPGAKGTHACHRVPVPLAAR